LLSARVLLANSLHEENDDWRIIVNTRLARLFQAILTGSLLLVLSGTALAQESAASENSIGLGPMIAILGMGVLAVLLVGLIVNARNSSDETSID
jgi:hypothetical protein